MDNSIQIGDKTVDLWLKRGVVIAVQLHGKVNPVEDHGSITVLLDTGEEEHYVHFNWKSVLRRVA